MLPILKNKKVIFFDVGYTLDMPASGDWMMTGAFLEAAGGKLEKRSDEEIRRALDLGLKFLTRDHHVTTVEEECDQFRRYYMILSDALDLGFTPALALKIAEDRAFNMDNYIPCPGAKEVTEALSRTHALGVISDTWPSISGQLEHLGIAKYFSFHTYSCCVGAFKPDPRIYQDALNKAKVPAEDTVFIDDVPRNLEGAAALKITPILIAVKPGPAPETPYPTIRDLRELI
ncbi:MAG: HAD-IA family hydrolase [Clostridia bacterium]|nr:HAD-IA family hydrolase [Clostridia bacterium]